MDREKILAQLDDFMAGEMFRADPAPMVEEETVEVTPEQQRIAHLETALERRTVIGQASGIVMERYGVSAEAAFNVLARISSHTNRKVYEIATQLVETRHSEGL